MNSHNSIRTRSLFSILAIGLLAMAVVPEVRSQSANSGDIERGKSLFTTGYKCFACHGYDAQSGARRLVPMNFTLPGFTALVQNSPFPQMPSFNDVPASDLAAIFAYIQTIPADAPPLDDIDLLSEIARRKQRALEN